MLGAVEDGQSVQVGQFVLEWLHTPGLREGGREETGCKARERGGGGGMGAQGVSGSL